MKQRDDFTASEMLDLVEEGIDPAVIAEDALEEARRFTYPREVSRDYEVAIKSKKGDTKRSCRSLDDCLSVLRKAPHGATASLTIDGTEIANTKADDVFGLVHRLQAEPELIKQLMHKPAMADRIMR